MGRKNLSWILVIYSDVQISSETVIRTFDESIDPIELQWHRDDEDRTIIAINKTDWKIQLENELPIDLNTAIFIDRGQWHRLIKGTDTLKVKIVKSSTNKK
jgi:hypothetical protein